MMKVLTDFFLGFFRGSSFKPTIIILYSLLALVCWKYIPAAPHLADLEGHQILDVNNCTPQLFLLGARKIFAAFFLMGVGPFLIVKFLFREKISDYGLRLGDFSRTVRTLMIYLPIMILISFFSAAEKGFYAVYPYNPWSGAGSSAFWIHAVLYLFFYYLAWEFLFRGFIQHGLEASCGLTNAILIQTLASVMLHFGHPFTEVLGSIAGGLFWGFIVVRTRSLYSGWLQHAALGIFLDYFLIRNIT
ncbi:MAG: CPBP family intramembrane metalloprotease [Planctomycetia bacterium]|nr:CPBP family intramembrane metalloprotease [Planctomycetia bacterium]